MIHENGSRRPKHDQSISLTGENISSCCFIVAVLFSWDIEEYISCFNNFVNSAEDINVSAMLVDCSRPVITVSRLQMHERGD
jgi:hypothetical protein